MALRNNIVPAPKTDTRPNRQKYHTSVPDQILDMSRKGMFPEEWCASSGSQC